MDSTKQTTLTVSMTEQEKYELKVAALQQNIFVSELIRRWLREHKAD